MRLTRSLCSTGVALALLLPSTSFAETISVDASATQRISSNFLNIFLQGTASNGLSAVFDVRAFRSHPCYSAVGEEINYCMQLFGITSDFESMVEDNSLNRMIIEQSLHNRCTGLIDPEYDACVQENVALLPQLLAEIEARAGDTLTDEDMDDTVDSTVDDDRETEDSGKSQTMSLRQRAQHVWELCADDDRGQAGCYQGFVRFVHDDSVPLSMIEDLVR